jgi:hypothetical protein
MFAFDALARRSSVMWCDSFSATNVAGSPSDRTPPPRRDLEPAAVALDDRPRLAAVQVVVLAGRLDHIAFATRRTSFDCSSSST